MKPVTANRLRGVAISEAIAWGVLSAVGLHVADPFVVRMSREFAEDLTRQCGYDPPVEAGRHWGTMFIRSGVGLDRHLGWDTLDQIAEPGHLFRLYLVDELTANRDRLTEGNTLLVTHPDLPARLVAIDQSNCFTGPDCVINRECLAGARDRTWAQPYQVMEQVLLRRGSTLVDEELALIRARADAITECVRVPHDEWYDLAGVDPDELAEWLEHRIRRIEELARCAHWRGMADIENDQRGLAL